MPRSLKAAPGSQSLERGLDVLEVVEAEGADIGVREIARRLDLSPTIVQRMVTSLAKRGYVDRNAETARYRLGYRALALGANSSGAGADYIGTARRELERLARGNSLNGFVSVLHDGRAVYLLAVQAGLRHGCRGEYPWRSVGRRADPRPQRQGAGGAQRRLPEISRFGSHPAEHHASGGRRRPAHLACRRRYVDLRLSNAGDCPRL